MENYKPNSYKSKEGIKSTADQPKRKVEKVISGDAKLKKKSEVKKLSSLFVTEDVGNIKSYVIFDVIIPNIKRVIVDVVINSVEMAFLGETSSRRRNSGSSSGRPSYQRYYDSKDDRHRERDVPARRDYEYDDITLDTRGDAEEVLHILEDYIDDYGSASVAELYAAIGKTAPYTAHKHGWTDLRNASIERTRDGYWIRLPRALPLLKNKGE